MHICLQMTTVDPGSALRRVLSDVVGWIAVLWVAFITVRPLLPANVRGLHVDPSEASPHVHSFRVKISEPQVMLRSICEHPFHFMFVWHKLDPDRPHLPAWQTYMHHVKPYKASSMAIHIG